MWNALKENIKIDEKQSEVKVFNEVIIVLFDDNFMIISVSFEE